jgi:hypothetical protein
VRASSSRSRKARSRRRAGSQPRAGSRKAGSQPRGRSRKAGSRPRARSRKAGSQPRAGSRQAGSQPRAGSRTAGSQPRGRSRKAKRPAAPAQRPRRPSPAEGGLLDLARSLTEAPTAAALTDGLTEALARLEGAFGEGAFLPRQLAQSWLRIRGDKTAMLALGWAREQVRRALFEVIQRECQRGVIRTDAPEVLAWLLLAAAEVSAHEPGATVGDRLAIVRDLLCRPGR